MSHLINNILIVKLSAIGDVIHTLPALTALRRRFPTARITWLVESAAADLVLGHPALDRVIVSHRKKWLSQLRGPEKGPALRAISDFVRTLRDTRYDVILDFQALLKSGLLIALSRGGCKLGFGPGLEHMEHSYIFLNRKIPAVSMEIHALTRNLIMLRDLGIPSSPIDCQLPISAQERLAVAGELAHHGILEDERLVAVNPMAKWATKLWEPDKFARLADQLIQKFALRVVFTGGQADRTLLEQIIQAMKHPAVNLAGKTTLKTLAALYDRASLVISTDTGPMHLAAAVGTPVVALFGPTAPWRTGPFGTGHHVIRTGIECSPCFKRHCPSPRCMSGISVAQVLAGIRQTGALG